LVVRAGDGERWWRWFPTRVERGDGVRSVEAPRAG